MALLYALTLFVSASLLFAVQPMAGRMLLPALGGSPAVWNTCLVFFQAVLLLGYLYAHVSTARLGVRTQAGLHLLMLLVPLAVLPVAVNIGSDIDQPALWLLGTLTVAVGLPFFAVSTTAPVLQSWFATTGHRSADDPYFLYAASNAGSLLALVAYPFVLEPWLSLGEQADWWRWGYVGFVALCVLCGVPILGRRDKRPACPAPGQAGRLSLREERTTSTLRWLVLAFIPSSLLIGVTAHLTTDIAPIPLLWVVPLALYLLTFILAFSARIRLPLGAIGRATAIGVLCLTLTLLTGATEPLWLVLPLHLAVFFCAALLCHGHLARLRPPVRQLTAFYLWMSLGGVLGGLFNALVAPIVFHKVGNAEYPLMLVLVCLIRTSRRLRLFDLVGPIMVAAGALGLLLAARYSAHMQTGLHALVEMTSLPVEIVRSAVVFGLPLIVVYCFIDWPIRFTAGLGMLLLVGAFDPGSAGPTLYLERNFLGTVRVTRDAEGRFHRMVHGNTIHGQQRIGSPTPLTYYHPIGPAGRVFQQVIDTWKGPRRIGAVGLGTGSMAYYARPDQDWVFFELDPAVERIARDERFFTYLRDCRAASLRVVLGDARLRLAAEPDHSFDVLILDAFSSDAIPIHLLTAEALALYDAKLRAGGLLLFHVSNRYLDLAPVLSKLGESAPRPWTVRYANDPFAGKGEEEGKYPSQWVLLARRPEDIAILAKGITWLAIQARSDTPRWTDAHANLLSAWKKPDEE